VDGNSHLAQSRTTSTAQLGAVVRGLFKVVADLAAAGPKADFASLGEDVGAGFRLVSFAYGGVAETALVNGLMVKAHFAGDKVDV
jgi:hypothetical protein